MGASFSDPNVKELRGGKMTRIHKFRHLFLILFFSSFFATKLHIQNQKWNQCLYLICSDFDFIWVFPKIGVPQNGWFIIEKPIKVDDLGVPLFLETPI